MEKSFNVAIRNVESRSSLVGAGPGRQVEQAVDAGTRQSVEQLLDLRDGKWVGFRGTPNDRYQRNSPSRASTPTYLLETATGQIERLTTNSETVRARLFSPDSRWIAVSAPRRCTYLKHDRSVRAATTAAANGGNSARASTATSHRLLVRRRKNIYSVAGVKAHQPGHGARHRRGAPGHQRARFVVSQDPGPASPDQLFDPARRTSYTSLRHRPSQSRRLAPAHRRQPAAAFLRIG